MDNIIEFKNIKSGILENIDIKIAKNSITTITGANCSGKSTLAKYLRKKLNTAILISDNYDNFYDLTVEDYILTTAQDKKEYEKIKRQLNINSILKVNIDKLNDSNKQLIRIIKAILSEDEIIIFDDALSDIDSLQKEKLFKIFKKSQKTIINITNNVEESIYGEYVILLNDGKVILSEKTKLALTKEKEFKLCNLDLPFMASLSLKLKYYDLIDELYLDMNKLVNKLWK